MFACVSPESEDHDATDVIADALQTGDVAIGERHLLLPTRSAYPPSSASTTDASMRFIAGVPMNCATNTSCGWS